MKQGDTFIKFLMVLLAAVVLAYFGYAAYGYFSEPVTTVTALAYEADVGAAVTGFVVREELPLWSDAAITVPTRAEGEHVGAGQTVAVTYESDDARQRRTEIENLTAQIEMLSAAADEHIPREQLDDAIAQELSALAAQTALQQDVQEDARVHLKALVIRSDADEAALDAIEAELSVLQNERARLISAGEHGAVELKAEAAGYFSGTADGYETILTPQALETMTLDDYRALRERDGTAEYGCYGRLICSDRWYFVTEVDASLADGLGTTVRLSFARDALRDIPMEVARVGEAEDGAMLLVLEGSSFVQELTLLREQSCTVKTGSYAGLRVPKEAVRIGGDGEAGVYVLEGAVACWKPITILHETGEHYVAALDTSSTDHLWLGDEILLGSGLYDGKVVYQ